MAFHFWSRLPMELSMKRNPFKISLECRLLQEYQKVVIRTARWLAFKCLYYGSNISNSPWIIDSF
jgi:hypothetical protein